ncbi:MAG: hypothetical protein HY890_07260 [Deltaproteobacteria bacterium]|nr:hypothetical protein [Deltaproteobacteria bacterium]
MNKLRLARKDDIFFTRTMAEILEKQGRMEDALTIYKILSDSNPEDSATAEMVKRLKELAGQHGKRGNRGLLGQGAGFNRG